MTSARPVPSDCVQTATAWPSGVNASCGERAKPPGAERRVAAPKAVAPGARVAEKIAPPFGQTATAVPSASFATTDSNAAPSGRRVLAPAVRLAMAIV